MAELPACSVIVPTFERPRQLSACLRGVANLDYPPGRLQVVVVDDGSRERVVPPVELGEGLTLDLVRQARSGPAAARNHGAERASGELFAFIDDDCVPRPDWLRRLAERWIAGTEDGVGGRAVNALPGNLCSTAAQLVIDVGYRQSELGSADRRWFTTNNLAVSAAGFRSVGGFDPSYRTAEDRDFCSRWGDSGRRFAYEPAAVVEHAHDLDLTDFARLHFTYGRGALRFHRDQRRRGRPVRIERRYYASLVREPLRRERLGRALGLEALLLLWHLANTAGFFWEWSRGAGRGDR